MNDRAIHSESACDDADPGDARLGDLVDEFAARWRAGEIADPEEFIRANEAHADALRQLLPTVQVMAELGDDIARPQPGFFDPIAPAAGDSNPRTLGDFRIVREIGRGGMGVVYEAVQRSLDRRVALKVLPLAATLDERRLQRFRKEAQAAAHLHHSHIVPVFAVGCERGVHYYAMQFIEGEPLSATIADLRKAHRGDETPSEGFASETLPSSDRKSFYRSVARLAARAAEALEYAHNLGVIHRDIKPANILVERGGHPWITDFGLARMEADPELTMTGDVVGTLRYMSPEQALGRRELVDHRADIYSLGATLYELLTLEPVFAGTNRRSLLRQVAEDEPRPPRRIHAGIPRELDTIALKALAKRPADRYPSAQEMADDLHRFLRDEPIRARRPSLRQRTLKWMRRHRAVVATAAACCLVSVVAVAATVGWAIRDRAARRAAEHEEVDDAIAQTRRSLTAGDVDSAFAELQRAERMIATGNVAGVASEIESLKLEVDLCRQLEAARLLRGHGANFGIEQGYLDHDRADAAYAAAFARLGVDFDRPVDDGLLERLTELPIRSTLAAALDDWTLVRLTRRERQDASWRAMLAAASRLDGDARRASVRQAILRGDAADLLRIAGSPDTANFSPQTALLVAAALVEHDLAREAVALLKSAQRRRSDDFWLNYTLACYCLRWLHNEDEALRFAGAAVSLRPDLPAPHLLLGHTLAELERPEDGLAEAREALRLKPDYAAAHMFVCRTLGELQRFDEAVAAGRKAIRLEPDNTVIRRWVAHTMSKAGLHDEAAAELHEVLRQDASDEWARCWLGHVYAAQGKWRQARDAYEGTIRLNRFHAESYDGLARALTHLEDFDGAEAARREALRIVPHDPELYGRLASLLAARGKWREAWKVLDDAIDVWLVAAKFHLRRGDAYAMSRGDEQAVTEYRLALRDDPADREAWRRLAEALRRLGRADEAIEAFRSGLEPRAEHAFAYRDFAALLIERGDKQEAASVLATAHELMPDSRSIQSQYGYALCLVGNRTDGTAHLRSVLQRDPNYAQAKKWLAEFEAAPRAAEPVNPGATP